MSRTPRQTPAELSHGEFPELTAGDPWQVVVAATIATRLQGALDRGWTLRTIAVETGVNHATLHRIIAGDVWVDAATIARLEDGLGMRLWPSHPSKRTSAPPRR